MEGSGRKARDRIEHFLRAAIDNANTRKAYGRSLGSFFAFLEDGGKERVRDISPLDVRDYLEAVKADGLSTATLKQHMAAIRMLFDHLVTGGVLEDNPALSVKAPRQKLTWPLRAHYPNCARPTGAGLGPGGAELDRPVGDELHPPDFAPCPASAGFY